jgi:hypothetical protein
VNLGIFVTIKLIEQLLQTQLSMEVKHVLKVTTAKVELLIQQGHVLRVLLMLSLQEKVLRIANYVIPISIMIK